MGRPYSMDLREWVVLSKLAVAARSPSRLKLALDRG